MFIICMVALLCTVGGNDVNIAEHMVSQRAATYEYGKVLGYSILFFEAQRSGKLPATNKIKWRGDSALSDKSDKGEDLTGGWYDAGDFVKFGLPMASSATLLIWGLLEWEDSYRAIGELDNMYNSIKWPLDYFIKCHTGPTEFYVQVGDGNSDHSYWGRPEEMTMARPAFKITESKPGSDLVGETAAALAAGSIAFLTKNPTYSKLLLKHAKELYTFATKHTGIYTQSMAAASQFYSSSGYIDELPWAAAWLYKATKDNKYLQDANRYYTSGTAWGQSCDDKKVGYQVLLYCLTKNNKYKYDIDSYVKSWEPGHQLPYTPKGLAYRLEWGPNRYAANSAFIALMAASCGLNDNEYNNWAKSQIDYMLRDAGHSYVVGFGLHPPQKPHHRSRFKTSPN